MKRTPTIAETFARQTPHNETINVNFDIQTLGAPNIASPITHMDFVRDDETVLYHRTVDEVTALVRAGETPPHFEQAGPREKIYFDPTDLRCGIVSCGGLCPGINDVIRALVMSLYHHYGVRTVLGFRYGYEGLIPEYGHDPVELTPVVVDDIHKHGGTMLGSSRGHQDPATMVDTLVDQRIGILFTVGGDGTLRGARAIAEEIDRRELPIGVVGIPKTIDNDIACIDQSFGFATAVSEASQAIQAANIEAEGARNGIGLVKLMGRHSGFIAAFATLAHSEVNFCLVPEVPFSLDGFLSALETRLIARGHAVIVVAEGAGQDLMAATADRDASGNVRLGDIGLFLKEKIKKHFAQASVGISLKYIDPSYTIRSMPANAYDSAYCLMLAHNAVHAGMAGKTNLVIGDWRRELVHVPIAAAVAERKRIDPDGPLWNAVVSATGQPSEMA